MDKTADTHRHSIDLLRFLAAFGIVWAHLLNPHPLAAIGYGALALFLILVPYFSVRFFEARAGEAGPGRGRRRGYSLRRMQRLILPWLFWSAVFKALLVLQSGDPGSLFALEDPLSLLVGPVIHLWFLPFIFLGTGLVLLAQWMIRDPGGVILGSALAFLLSLASLWAHERAELPAPFAQWSFALPAFLFGLLAAFGQKYRVLWAPVAGFVAVALVWKLAGAQYWPWQYLLALAVFALAWRFELRSPLFPALGALAYGIYLVHPFFMAVWYHFVEPGRLPFLAVAVVFTLSALTTAVMRRLPYLRAVV